MQLKRDFLRILDQYGHDALLLHSDRQTTCTCYNPLTGSIEQECPFCFGMGTIPTIEKIRVRERDLNVPETLPYLASIQLFGEMAVATRAYYLDADIPIQAHDLILDVDWEGDRPVYSGRGLFEVSHVDKKRFEKGAFVFQIIYVKNDPIQKSIRSINIIERAGETLYQLESDTP